VDDGDGDRTVVFAVSGDTSTSASYDDGKCAPRFRNIARGTLRNIHAQKINNLSHASRSPVDVNEESISLSREYFSEYISLFMNNRLLE